jgi:hypothetical protein
MKTCILCAAILVLHYNTTSAQPGIPSKEVRFNTGTTRPLVLLDTFQTDINYLFINPNKIQSISIFKDSTATAKYGQAGKYGVIVIHPKDNTVFLQVGKILDKFNISGQDRTLRICVNNTVIKQPRFILIEKSELMNVEITTEKHWVNVEDANSDERFINIITQTKAEKGL